MKTLILDDFDRRDIDAINEMLIEALQTLGYEPASFDWAITVNFEETENQS